MGPVRQHKLIRALALLASLDLLVGVVLAYTRSASAFSPGAGASHASAAPAGPVGPGSQGGAGGDVAADASGTAPASYAGGSPLAAGGTPSEKGQPKTITSGPTTRSTTGATSSTAPVATGSTTGPSGGTGPGPGADNPDSSTPALGVSPSATGSSPLDPGWAVLQDPAGDTVVDDDGGATVDRRADIVESGATHTGQAIGFTVQTAQHADPRQDPNWASSKTFIAWEVDTTGDGVPDFDVQFFLEDGKPVAGVSRAGDDDVDSVCESPAEYVADRYVAAFEARCLGNPTSFSYRVTLYYDTDVKDDDSDVLSDVAPNAGLSPAVHRRDS
ncbi:MAG: hypothetical protein LC792_07135 [Actinobacteria bacterium]|nr:hypothetical protein [Actinomycetota bacterium]